MHTKKNLKKEFFRFLKEKGKEKNSGISILQAYKCSITLWVHRLQESGNAHYKCSIQCFNFALEKAINNYGCSIINNSFNWQISAHEYNLDFALWPSLDTEWNAKILKRGHI